MAEKEKDHLQLRYYAGDSDSWLLNQLVAIPELQIMPEENFAKDQFGHIMDSPEETARKIAIHLQKRRVVLARLKELKEHIARPAHRMLEQALWSELKEISHRKIWDALQKKDMPEVNRLHGLRDAIMLWAEQFANLTEQIRMEEDIIQQLEQGTPAIQPTYTEEI